MDFTDLVRRISPKLLAISHKLNGKFTFFNEEDLYQEALLYLWKEYGKGTLFNKTESFVVQGCYFFLKNHIRKIYKTMDRNCFCLSDITSDQDEGSVAENIIFLDDRNNEIDFLDTELLLDDIRKNLSDREIQILTLCMEGLTTREIGKRLGISHVMVVKIEKKIRDKCSKFREEII